MKQHQPQMLGKTHVTYKPKARVLSLTSAAWRALRAEVLADQPLCQHCYDDYRRITPATDVDHIDNNGDNNDRYNLQSLCHSCHSKKTRAEMYGYKPKIVGCDVNGWPLDPEHAWNREEITSNRPDQYRVDTLARTAADEEFDD